MAGPITKKSKASRFPAARIKKIMQMDEDVGKLASATPVMISKSLECFMQLLLDESSKEARSRGSKKLTAYHLKHTINNTPSFDFLLDIVSKIPDPTTSDPLDGTGGAGPSSSSRRKPSSSGPSSTGATRGRKRKSGVTERGQEELKKGIMEEVKPDIIDDNDGDGEEQMEYHGRGNIRPGMSDLLNPSEPEIKPGVGGEPEKQGETGGRGMFDDYEDDDDY